MHLARYRGYEVVATDILSSAIEVSRRCAQVQSLEGRGAGRVHCEVQDGRALSFDDGAFDAAYAISVLEHIPDRGDTAALRELVRVVRSGGRIVITTPYATSYGESFVDADVYERKRIEGRPTFFERQYDDPALQQRLLGIPQVRVLDREIWGEGGWRVEALLERLGSLRSALAPFEALLAKLALRPIRSDSDGEPLAAFLVLEKE
jgi:SAM-dependent methyltransferase